MNNKIKSFALLVNFITAALVNTTAFAVQSIDSDVPEYQKASGVSGNLSSVGSDTLANLMTLWADSGCARVLSIMSHTSSEHR
jgi:phosphate transport system substrate-binding protein